MYFRVNLKMKKPTLYCYFIWIIFIELDSVNKENLGWLIYLVRLGDEKF